MLKQKQNLQALNRHAAFKLYILEENSGPLVWRPIDIVMIPCIYAVPVRSRAVVQSGLGTTEQRNLGCCQEVYCSFQTATVWIFCRESKPYNGYIVCIIYSKWSYAWFLNYGTLVEVPYRQPRLGLHIIYYIYHLSHTMYYICHVVYDSQVRPHLSVYSWFRPGPRPRMWERRRPCADRGGCPAPPNLLL